jgi:membrane protease YdiL (CAAX protease family)
MDTMAPLDIAKPPDPPAPEPTVRVWLEVCVVLAVAVIPDFFAAASILVLPDRDPTPPAYTALWYVIRSIQVSLPVLYIMGRSGRPWSYFGIRPLNLADLLRALVIAMSAIAVSAVYWLLAPEDRRHNLLQAPERGTLPFALFVGIPNGFSEELAMRGYLIPRLEQLLGTKWDGIFISAALFASYHIYQGIVGTVHIFLIGLILGGAFCLTRRLWPVVLVHSTVNVLQLWLAERP